MTTEFEELVSDFEALVEKSEDLTGAERKANLRAQVKVQKLLSAIIETGMTSYNDVYTDCRDLGHRWDEAYSNWEANQLTRLSHCDRCGSEKLEAFSRTGYCLSRKYTYAEGYLMVSEEIRNVGGRKKQYWRAVNVQRAISGV